MTGHEGRLVNIGVSPNGKLLVSASNYGRIQVCNAENGDPIWAVETDTNLKSTSISPNGQFVVSLSHHRDGVRIWNANDGHPFGTFPYYATSISCSPDSNELAGIYQKGLVQVWGISRRTAKPTQKWRIGAQPTGLFFSPSGRQLASTTDVNVHIIHRDGHNIATFTGHTRPVTSLAFSPDGLTLASGSLDGTIRVWDVSSIGTSGVSSEKAEQEEWAFVHWSPRGQVVMASNFGSRVWTWNTADGTSRIEDRLRSFPVAISDCGRYLASQNNGTITTRRIASNVPQSGIFSLPAPDTHCYEFFPDSTRFAVSSGREIYTWDASVVHPEVTSLLGHSANVDDLGFVPNCSRLLSRAGGEIFAWDVDTLQLVSRSGNVIPHYRKIEVNEDNWVVIMLPNGGGQRRLFRLPSSSAYQLYKASGIYSSKSWLSMRLLLECRNGNALIVDFSALP